MKTILIIFIIHALVYAEEPFVVVKDFCNKAQENMNHINESGKSELDALNNLGKKISQRDAKQVLWEDGNRVLDEYYDRLKHPSIDKHESIRRHALALDNIIKGTKCSENECKLLEKVAEQDKDKIKAVIQRTPEKLMPDKILSFFNQGFDPSQIQSRLEALPVDAWTLDTLSAQNKQNYDDLVGKYIALLNSPNLRFLRAMKSYTLKKFARECSGSLTDTGCINKLTGSSDAIKKLKKTITEITDLMTKDMNLAGEHSVFSKSEIAFYANACQAAKRELRQEYASYCLDIAKTKNGMRGKLESAEITALSEKYDLTYDRHGNMIGKTPKPSMVEIIGAPALTMVAQLVPLYINDMMFPFQVAQMEQQGYALKTMQMYSEVANFPWMYNPTNFTQVTIPKLVF